MRDVLDPPPGTEEGAREPDASLLDLVDNALTKGVVVSGDVVLGLAGVDLVYLRLSAVLCAVETLLRKADR